MKKKEVIEKFGTFEEYLKALKNMPHPRHKEAMEIRAERMKKENKVIFVEQNGELNMFKI